MIRPVVLLAAAAALAPAHDVITTKVTYSKEIVRLIDKRCTGCHVHTDSDSAFLLTNYDGARPWAKAIKEEVDARRMPPWQAVKGFAEFKEDRGLTQEEIELIDDWVEGGAPEGNPKFVPASPKILDWKDAEAPQNSSEIVAGNATKLDSSARVLAVRPKDLKKGASVQVLAARPDGSIAPLLWIYHFNPDFARTYYYVAPLDLPAGTEIEMSPPDAGTVALFAKVPKASARSTRGGAR
ncbi:MAG TPA: hypothetical protein VMG40_01965 [Bryobacteraceae bacterium]|nr:hypothetical protein [Bryobacteraceae bacterium]